jgi:GNAT superfamily N-acetyltransferase
MPVPGLSVGPSEEAGYQDSGALIWLREDATRWLQERGVRQWDPSDVSRGEIRAQLSERQWYVLREGPAVVGGLRLLWSDEPVWGLRPPDAAYVHGLVVDKRHAGNRLGALMLNWAEGRTRQAGRLLLRLDCAETNSALRRYYCGQGFGEVGRRDLDGPQHSVVLFEKNLR